MKKSVLLSAVGRRIRSLREKDKLSRAELADRAGMGAFSLAKVELGVSDCKISTLEKLGRALHEPMTALLEDLPGEDKGRTHRRAINEVIKLIEPLDEDSIRTIRELVQTTLKLRKKGPQSR